ncbi:MAG: type VI secretion system baseplate subunit TssK [Bacteroidota bacterium]
MAQDRGKTVWYEGMTLDPHHLQQWDRYHQGVVHARVGALTRHGWGLTELALDEERLANGEVALLRCAGVMPDGLPFSLPDEGPLPEPRSLGEHFAATGDALSVVLAIPAERPGGGNVARNGAASRETRFAATPVSLPDDTTGADERTVEVAQPRFRIGFGTEALPEFTVLPVAEVHRRETGLFALRETFIPTCLRTGASARLNQFARRLLELLVARSTTLADRWRGVTQQRELSPADLTVLGLNLAMSTYVPLLNHHHARGDAHPEALYTTLLALAGHLAAFTPGASTAPRDYPVYAHADLTTCFNALDAILMELLGGAAPKANYARVPLREERENLYVAQPDGRLLDEAQFFLLVRSDDLPEARLAQELPQMIRVASPDTIDAVLRSYTRALSVEHTNRLPSGVPMDNQATYFQLQKRGPFWEAIQASGGLAIFVPAEFGQLHMELIAT